MGYSSDSPIGEVHVETVLAGRSCEPNWEAVLVVNDAAAADKLRTSQWTTSLSEYVMLISSNVNAWDDSPGIISPITNSKYISDVDTYQAGLALSTN
ncbi:hypothetical protein DPMN_006555 [Dreissena polymorpha]|uniref:Uncharacterized protein n=1 Tax=Dreissena polymorpha TaxID=45954 RepID=A0A9D4RXK5_DREPO|nr:hypothetical protein DPMN_006555 [Dreissena polymorpha]